MSREHRTLHRWLAGQPIPKAAKQWLIDYVGKRNYGSRA
jgi:hypothetical protein